MNVILSRTGKQFKLSQSTQLMANERETVEKAYAGDVIGIYDTGNYQIGDTLTTSKQKIFLSLCQHSLQNILKEYTLSIL